MVSSKGVFEFVSNLTEIFLSICLSIRPDCLLRYNLNLNFTCSSLGRNQGDVGLGEGLFEHVLESAGCFGEPSACAVFDVDSFGHNKIIN